MKGPTLPVLTAANVSMPRHTHTHTQTHTCHRRTHRGWGHWVCSGHVPSPPVKCHITVCINTASSQKTNMWGGSNGEECCRLFVCLSPSFPLSSGSPTLFPLLSTLFPVSLSPSSFPPSPSFTMGTLSQNKNPSEVGWHSNRYDSCVHVCVRCGFDGGVDGSCSLKHSLLRLIGKHESSPQHSLFCYTSNMTQACEHEHILRSLQEINGVEKKRREHKNGGSLSSCWRCINVPEVSGKNTPTKLLCNTGDTK